MITAYQNNYLDIVKQYKSIFFISITQIESELLYPKDLKEKVKESITVIEEDREEIRTKTNELMQKHSSLSSFDCLSLAYALLDGYILVTNDHHLIMTARKYNICVNSFEEISRNFLK